MEYTTLCLILMLSPYLIFSKICGNERKLLPDLRRHKIVGVGGRFVVDRDALKQALQDRKQQDASCGQDVKIQLPKSLPHSSYNESYQGEVILYYSTITDHTLATELPDRLKEQVDTSYQIFRISIPVFFGETEQHGLLFLHSFTNSTRKIPVPYSTSSSEVTHVDSIEEEADGKITLRLGDDFMIIRAQGKDQADSKRNVGDDFDKIIGKVILKTNYPLPFDWDCEYFGSEISFCKVLDGVRCELAAVGADVCTLTSVISSYRSLATMEMVNITGIFQQMFPYLAKIVPSESFEAEAIDREHATGILYPCLTA